MPYFALFYDTVDDFASRRTPFRAAHLDLVRAAHARGEILLAGALADPVDRALLVFKTADRSVVDRFVEQDPYPNNGLVKRVEIRSWTVVVPSDEPPR